MSRNRTTVGALVVFALVAGSGCFVTTNLNSAKVLPQGESAVTIGVIQVPAMDGAVTTFSYRNGMMEDIEFGLALEMMTFRADMKYQFLKSDEHGVDMAADVGMGLFYMTLPVYQVGLGVSRTFGKITPFLHYRYSGLGMISTADLAAEDEDNFFDFTSDVAWQQLSLGAQIHLGEKFSIVVEHAWIYGVVEAITLEKLTAVNVGVRIGSW